MSEGNPLELTPVAVESTHTVARALYLPQWDENVRRGSPGCFKRNNTSVTVQKSLSFTELIARLKVDVEKPGSDVVVRAVGLITVARIKEIGMANPTPVYFELWEKPTSNNPDHAEIFPYDFAAQAKPKKEVPRGLSGKLTSALDLTIVGPSGEVEGYNPPVTV